MAGSEVEDKVLICFAVFFFKKGEIIGEMIW